MNKSTKATKRDRRHKRIRAKISGTESRPRLSIFKSNKAIYAQLINDVLGNTLVAVSGKDANKVGAEVAKKATAKGIKAVVFDRGGYNYTGQVKQLADSAREGGLDF